jgi:hypothetical protein
MEKSLKVQEEGDVKSKMRAHVNGRQADGSCRKGFPWFLQPALELSRDDTTAA